MNRLDKETAVASLRTRLESANLVLITSQTGLTVDEANALRRKMRAAGAEYKVMKNSLSCIAVQGTPMAGLEAFFTGPTAVSVSQDPVATAKAAMEFANDNDKLSVIGGFMDGQVLTKADIDRLSKLPSRDELRAQLIALLQTPATRIARLAAEPASQLARVFGAYAKQ